MIVENISKPADMSEEEKLQERVRLSPLHQDLYKYIFQLDKEQVSTILED